MALRCAAFWALLAIAPAVAAEPLALDLERLQPGIREAVVEAQQALAAARGSDALAAAHGRLGQVLHAHELTEAALAAYREAVRLAPDAGRWHYLLGVLAHHAGGVEEAERHLSRALALAPDDALARLRRARLRIDAGDFDGAAADLAVALEQAPDQAAVHAELGALALAQRRFDAAVGHLERALALAPQASQLRASLGMAYRGQGQVERARAQLALRGDVPVPLGDPLMAEVTALSRSAQYYYELGRSQRQAGQAAAAEASLARAVELDPGRVEYVQLHADQLLRAGRLDAARQAFQRALALAPRSAPAHYFLARLEEIAGDDAQALQGYQRALELDPSAFEIRDRAAQVLLRLQRFDAAAEQFARLLEVAVDAEAQTYASYWLGMSRLAAGDCVAAAAALTAALEASGGRHAFALLATARQRATCGADSAALDEAADWTEAIHRAQPGMESAETLAMLLAARGQFEEAAGLQARIVFEALRSGSLAQRPDLSVLLERYRAGQPAEMAYAPHHPALARARLTRSDLDPGSSH
jgi:tetratricopeptide (TPR) repeat protein